MQTINKRMMEMLTQEQRKELEKYVTGDSIYINPGFFDPSIGDIHALYQNVYVKDIKTTLGKQSEINAAQRENIHLLKNKLEESSGEITKINAKLKAYKLYMTEGVNGILSDHPRKDDKRLNNSRRLRGTLISIEENKLQLLNKSLALIAKSKTVGKACENILE